jgi:RNA polymerase sigma-70 factor (ECF subfamily)
MEWVFETNGADWRLEPLRANGQQAFAAYVRSGAGYRLHTVHVFTVSSGGISRLTVFQDDTVFASFGLPLELQP